MKTLIWIIVIVVILGGIYWYATKDGEVVVDNGTETETETEAETEEASGAITKIDLEGMAADGPALITIENALGLDTVIAVPSFGRNLCAADANLADVATLTVGQKVEVRGSLSPDDQIVPCTEPDHYLRVAVE